jgi:hypothetical protein
MTSGGGVALAAMGKAIDGSSAGDGKSTVKGTTVERVSTERDDRVKGTQHGQTKDGVDSHVGAKGKRESARGSRSVNVGHFVSDDSGEIPVASCVKVSRAADGTAKLNRFKGV